MELSAPLARKECPEMVWWVSQDAPTSRSPIPDGCTGQYIPKDDRITGGS